MQNNSFYLSQHDQQAHAALAGTRLASPAAGANVASSANKRLLNDKTAGIVPQGRRGQVHPVRTRGDGLPLTGQAASFYFVVQSHAVVNLPVGDKAAMPATSTGFICTSMVSP